MMWHCLKSTFVAIFENHMWWPAGVYAVDYNMYFSFSYVGEEGWIVDEVGGGTPSCNDQLRHRRLMRQILHWMLNLQLDKLLWVRSSLDNFAHTLSSFSGHLSPLLVWQSSSFLNFDIRCLVIVMDSFEHCVGITGLSCTANTCEGLWELLFFCF